MGKLSYFWQNIQKFLFPALEECLGPLTEQHKRLAAILEVVRIEELAPRTIRGLPGRPTDSRRALARAFVAKTVLNLPTTSALIETIRADQNLRLICGWQERSEIPSEATFSRAFAEFAKTELAQKSHVALVREHLGDRTVGHLSRDSTAIEAREKPVRKPKAEPQPKLPRGRPRKSEPPRQKEPTRLERQAAQGMDFEKMLAELPKCCDASAKKNSKGHSSWWVGYKAHIDWADGAIPVSCVLTSASVHDSQVALPLAAMSAGRVRSYYELMDAAYDAPQIHEYILDLGHRPIIDHNPRRGEKREMDPATAVRYRERTNAERGNSMLKDNFGGRMVRVRGHAKVFSHISFGLLALSAEQLLRLVQ
jgi:hypothetical protein